MLLVVPVGDGALVGGLGVLDGELAAVRRCSRLRVGCCARVPGGAGLELDHADLLRRSGIS
jgi:hypothetical protein